MKSTTSYKNIITLAFPAIISGVSEPLIGSTDLILVGQNTVNGIAVVGIGGSAILSVIWILSSFLSPVAARVAHLHGENKKDQLHTLIQFLLKRVLLVSFVLASVLYLLSDQIISFYDSPEVSISKSAISYFQLRLVGLPFFLFSVFCFQIFRGLQNTMIALVVTLVGGGVNLVFDFLLIKGLLGFPELGVLGAAIASTISQIIMALGVLIYFHRFGFMKKSKAVTIYLKKLYSNSLNLFLRTILMNACILVGNRITAKQGGSYIETHTIMANIFIIVAYFLDGIAHAATAIIGKLKGEKNILGIRKVALRSLFLNTLIAFCFVSLIYLFDRSVVTFYTTNDTVYHLFEGEEKLFLMTMLIGSLAFTFDGIYIGLEDTIFLRNVLIAATILGYFPVLLVIDDYSLHSVWIALLVWMCFRSGLPFARFLIKKV
jgi:multidrug resistance protein, MATE family